ncbi:FadR/GntR family transcriptional regulator [Rhodococcus sp. ACPA1]|uniref:FadR/GntR family transcriptional regulator n=1 Tax=Rhodococcus sp. ACPA1 TaxID=2028572 RepID=UPI000BB120B0|nr:GntR family transcriptional regulator [Rhodococcus sp. ACPA1]PBC47566.1 transcriptional regulator [Rhodococcus sp. ACPA1]
MHTAQGLPVIYNPGFKRLDGIRSASARPPKASEVAASRIVNDIVSQGLQVNDRLPGEAEMLAAYGVSRETLREALRILEVQGMIAIKRGPGGGPIVTALNAYYLARTATMYFMLAGATYNELFEAWEVLEPPMSAKVARLSDSQMKKEAFEAAEMATEMSSGDEALFTAVNDFHAVIAQLSGNRVLMLLTQAVNHIVVDHILESGELMAESDISHAHAGITEAIIAGWPRRASQLMRDHIEEVVAFVRSRHPERMDDVIQWR